jgi:hypothetical protein
MKQKMIHYLVYGEILVFLISYVNGDWFGFLIQALYLYKLVNTSINLLIGIMLCCVTNIEGLYPTNNRFDVMHKGDAK